MGEGRACTEKVRREICVPRTRLARGRAPLGWHFAHSGERETGVARVAQQRGVKFRRWSAERAGAVGCGSAPSPQV